MLADVVYDGCNRSRLRRVTDRGERGVDVDVDVDVDVYFGTGGRGLFGGGPGQGG